MIEIDDPDDPRLAEFRLNERGLASRADKRNDAGAGWFLAEGDLVVERALASGCVPVKALVDAERVPQLTRLFVAAGCPVYFGGDGVRLMVTKLGIAQPIIALFERPARPGAVDLVARAERLVVVEGVDNPVNVGSVVRNAAALGWDGLLLDHTSADPLARRALRVAMGTAFDLPHARTTQLTDVLRESADIELFALTPDPAALDIQDVAPSGRRGIVIGSERAGLSADVLDVATAVRIPMHQGVDSLNAAAAAAIACFALR